MLIFVRIYRFMPANVLICNYPDPEKGPIDELLFFELNTRIYLGIMILTRIGRSDASPA